MCAFDYSNGACRGGRALSKYGNGRCDWQSSSSCRQMQKSSARKFHGIISLRHPYHSSVVGLSRSLRFIL
jgi:hypothetical protein